MTVIALLRAQRKLDGAKAALAASLNDRRTPSCQPEMSASTATMSAAAASFRSTAIVGGTWCLAASFCRSST